MPAYCGGGMPRPLAPSLAARDLPAPTPPSPLDSQEHSGHCHWGSTEKATKPLQSRADRTSQSRRWG